MRPRDQRRHFLENRWLGLGRAAWILACDLPEIMRMAQERHTDGIYTYGDRMYHWPAVVRRDNIRQELADAIVYGSGGRVRSRAS